MLISVYSAVYLDKAINVITSYIAVYLDKAINVITSLYSCLLGQSYHHKDVSDANI